MPCVTEDIRPPSGISKPFIPNDQMKYAVGIHENKIYIQDDYP